MLHTLEKNRGWVYAALAILYIALLVLSPAEATLGNVVKIVYAHGAAQRIAAYAFILSALLGLGYLLLRGTQFATKQSPSAPVELASQTLLAMTLARWTQALAEAALGFWIAQFVISIPAQILAWGGLTWNEPRVASSLWILALTVLVYIVTRWIGEVTWIAFGAIANTIIFLIIMRGAVNILHPLDPIFGSSSPAIIIFYLAIVIVTGAFALGYAYERARRISIPPEVVHVRTE